MPFFFKVSKLSPESDDDTINPMKIISCNGYERHKIILRKKADPKQTKKKRTKEFLPN